MTGNIVSISPITSKQPSSAIKWLPRLQNILYTGCNVWDSFSIKYGTLLITVYARTTNIVRCGERFLSGSVLSEYRYFFNFFALLLKFVSLLNQLWPDADHRSIIICFFQCVTFISSILFSF